MEKDQTLRSLEKAQLIEVLDLDTCPISDLGLVFELPGYENIELRKGGSEIPVTIHNLDQYIKVQWHIDDSRPISRKKFKRSRDFLYSNFSW